MSPLHARQRDNAPTRAGLLLIAGQAEQARALCEQALAEAPEGWEGRIQALQMLARVARRQHDCQRALEALGEVVIATPSAAAERYERGLASRSMALCAGPSSPVP